MQSPEASSTCLNELTNDVSAVRKAQPTFTVGRGALADWESHGPKVLGGNVERRVVGPADCCLVVRLARGPAADCRQDAQQVAEILERPCVK